MKKVLKKSFEDFVKERESLDRKVILTGNLYEDLKKYFINMIYRDMFYALPKNHAFKIDSVTRCRLSSFEIELLENDKSIMTCVGYFKVYEDGSIDEYLSNYNDEIKMQRMQRFILPMRELIKQMQRYYVDHNIKQEVTDHAAR